MICAEIRKNKEAEHSELWIDNQFQAGWAELDLNRRQLAVIGQMFGIVAEQAQKHGEAPLKERILKAINRPD